LGSPKTLGESVVNGLEKYSSRTYRSVVRHMQSCDDLDRDPGELLGSLPASDQGEAMRAVAEADQASVTLDLALHSRTDARDRPSAIGLLGVITWQQWLDPTSLKSRLALPVDT
jgi:hypothetical protein